MIISSLICHAHVPMATDCLGSVSRLFEEDVQFRIHDDGSLTGEDVECLQSALPVARIVRRGEADEIMSEAEGASSVIRKLRKEYLPILKILDIVEMENEPLVRILDSDVLIMRRCKGLLDLSSNVAARFMRDRGHAYSLRSWQLAMSPGVSFPDRVNVGVTVFDLTKFDKDFVRWFLEKRLHYGIPYLLEQAAWAALGMRVGTEVLDAKQVRVVREGEDMTRMIAGHFTARSRHLLPEFVSRSREADPEGIATPLRVDPPGRCGALDLLGYECRRLWGRLRPNA